MRQETRDALRRLEDAEWFSSVGHDDSGASQVKILSSWKEAIKSCSSSHWESITLETANILRERVQLASEKQFKQWHDKAVKVREIVIPLVTAKMTILAAKFELPDVVRQCVEWDMLHFAMECEYASIVAPALFTTLSHWYLDGHFPCGWDGSLQDGTLVIF